MFFHGAYGYRFCMFLTGEFSILLARPVLLIGKVPSCHERKSDVITGSYIANWL